jgi:hypothetical protein
MVMRERMVKIMLEVKKVGKKVMWKVKIR